MIENFEDIYEITNIIFNEVIDTAIYDNRMIAGLFYSWTYNGDMDVIDYMYEPREIQRTWVIFKNNANKVMNDINSFIDELKEDNEYNLSIVIEGIINWDDLDQLKFHLKKDNFQDIDSWEELKQTMKDYRDFTEWNNAIESYYEEVQHQLIERLMRNW